MKFAALLRTSVIRLVAASMALSTAMLPLTSTAQTPAPAPSAPTLPAPAAASMPSAMPKAPAVTGGDARQASAEYRLSLGDTIRVTVFQSPDLSLETRITESGVISYPLLGSVSLVGMSVSQAEKRIADGLKDGNFVKQPQVSINVIQVRGNQVSVLGQVGKPGRYPLESGDVRLTDIIATAGGINPTGSDTVVIVGNRDGKPYRQEVDMPNVFGSNRTSKDVQLQNGDVVWVERAPTVYVYGEVQRPGPVRLERGMTLMQVLATGGGLTPRGTERGIRVHRKDAEGVTAVLQPTLSDVLKPDDVVFVRESLF
jgi:polysaccharide biosynthesis/export protein